MLKHFIYIIFFIFIASCASKQDVQETSIDTIPMESIPDTLVLTLDTLNTVLIEEDVTSESLPEMSEEETEYAIITPVESDLVVDTISIVDSVIQPIIDTYELGEVTYVVSDTMFVNVTKTINLVISNKFKVEKMVTEVKAFLGTTTQTEPLRISEIMSVKLIDPNGTCFRITPITNTEQTIEKNNYTRWEWDITPLKKGIHTLKLTIDILDNKHHKNIRVYENFITVISTKTFGQVIKEFFIEYWQYLISGIILPFLFFYIKRRWPKKSK